MSERTKEVAIAIWLLFILALVILAATTGNAQNIEGQLIASQYGTWQVSGYAPDTYTGFAPTACRVQGGASFFDAFTVGTPIKIVDGNPALTETVTPTNVTINNNTCAISIAPANHHNLPFYLTSATGGLQEAINANVANPASNTIVLDNVFYRSVGPSNISAVIAAAIGYSNLGLVDITQTPYVWYAWNGSHYVVASTGNDVTSVFGRQGAVVAETGDYDCAQVTGCGLGANTYLVTTLSAGISATAQTIPLTSAASLTPRGEIVIGSEWIAYTGIFDNSLTGATRGIHQTAPASYSSGATVLSVAIDLTSPLDPPANYVLSNLGSYPALPAFNCAVPDQGSNVIFQIGCPGTNETFFNGDGAIEQTHGDDYSGNVFQSKVGIGPGGGKAVITDSGNLFDSTRQNQSTVPQGFGAGLAGPVDSIQPLTITAPSIVNFAQPSGSTTWSYECTGTDVDGNTFPGTVASITNGPATITSGELIVTCPFSAGAYSETIWRTAGGPNQGSISTNPQPNSVQDNGAAATPGTPPSTNSSIAKACVNGEQYCQLSGITSTPPVTCSSSTQGWIFHNVSATVSPFAQVCNGTSWVTAY